MFDLHRRKKTNNCLSRPRAVAQDCVFKPAYRRLTKLLKYQSLDYSSEETFRQKEYQVSARLRMRVAAGVEDVEVYEHRTTISTVKADKYAEMEQKHWAWNP